MGQTERREIYWKRSKQYGRQQELLAIWEDQDANKGAIRAFQEHLIAEGTGEYRVAKVMSHLRHICDECAFLRLPLATKADLRSAIAYINTREGWKEHSRCDYTRILKHYYRWYQEEDPRVENGDAKAREEARQLYQYLSRHVKVSKPRKKVGEDEIITQEDLQSLIRTCRTPLERAFLAVLHNTGARIGEMLNIRIRDYERKGKHALIKVDGKTGERRIPVLQAIPHLEEWLRIHPDRENSSAFLWVSMSERHYGKPLAYAAVKKLLERCASRAGFAQANMSTWKDKGGKPHTYERYSNFEKQFNPHWFRHSRASLWAAEFSQAMLCQLMGWAQGSSQAQTYVHLSARDVENSFLKVHGILPEEQRKPTAQFCACGQTNTSDAKYCYKCGQPLSVRVVMDEQEALRRAFAELPRILADPVLRARYEQKLREVTQADIQA